MVDSVKDKPTDAAKVALSNVSSRHHRHAAHRTNSICSLAQHQAAICSNRAIHISVIVLVAVMALWSVSIHSVF